MMSAPRWKLMFLVVAAALVVGACSSDTEVSVEQATESAQVESQPAAEPEDAAAEPAEPAPAAEADTATTDDAAGDAAPRIATVTFGDQDLSFDLWACPAFGPEFLNASGLPLDDTPADAEFSLAYELPVAGDGDTAEYNNTVTLTFGNDTWKAGTLENAVGTESWGELDWNREGDVVTGTAVMVHSWGVDSENSEPRNASFVVNCA